MDKFVEMDTFVTVVENRSFAAAARVLGVSQSRVSKSVGALEQRLRTQLLLRTTRSLSVTPAGEIFFRQAKAILSAVGEAEELAHRDQNEIGGRLRINTASMLALPLVQPALLAFQQLYPALAVEITVDDRRIDLVAEGVDLIVRVGDLDNSSLVVRRAGRVAFGFYATPVVVAGLRLPLPDLDALKGLPMIGLGRAATDERVVVSNATLALDAAKAGAGVAPLPQFLAEPEVASGNLAEIISPSSLGRSTDVSFLHGFGSSPPRRVKAFIDFAIERWRTAKLLS